MDSIARSTARVHRRAGLSLCLVALLALGVPPAAMEVADLYTASVPVDPRDDNWRAQAYRRGLSEILVRVTGQRTAATDPALAALFEDPARLVQGYRRDTDVLWVSFDGRAIASRLREAGRAVWGSQRPATLVWLAVDRGRGERELIAAADAGPSAARGAGDDPDAMLRKRAGEVATARGIPLVWPLLDAEDRSRIAFSDVWGGFQEPVLEASRRYGANSILLGRVDAGGRQLPRWTWYFGGEQRQWRATVEDAVHRVADLMAGQLAAVGDESTTTLRLTVTGVHDLESYADVGRYLSSVSVIRSLELTETSEGALTYRLQLLGATDRLGRVLRLSGRFGEVEQTVLGTGPLGTPDLTVEYRR